MLAQGRHLRWLDQVAVGKVLSLNCYNDSTILHKAKYVVKKLFMRVYVCISCVVCVCVHVWVCIYLSVCMCICLPMCLCLRTLINDD